MRSTAPRSFSPTPGRPSPGFAALATLAMLLLHGAIWSWIAFRRHQSLGELLMYWDAGHYTRIIREGYSGMLWVFYPAYPYLVRALTRPFGIVEVQWAGALLSTGLLAVFVAVCARASQREELPEALVPRTPLGWVFLLFAPASYALHSHHTEALFLLLSFLAFFFAGSRRPGWAGLFGALCCLTRNQGVFVGVCAALLAAWVEHTPGRRVRALLIAGGVSLTGVLALLAFETLAAGSPFAFMQAQQEWTHAGSLSAALETLRFGNPWQSTDKPNLLRYGIWWVLLLSALALGRRQPVLGLYALLSLLVQLLQGELVNTFRYATPVFPLFFFLGDACARAPRPVRVLATGAVLLLNVAVTRSYGLGEWAY